MIIPRLIPCLLLSGNALVKTKRFKDPVYLGDPVNTVKIFNDKHAQEIIVLDIDASRYGKELNYQLLAEMTGEAFMPVTYGGGIRTLDQVRRLIRLGIEKVAINTSAIKSLELIRAAVDLFGSQAVVGSIDVRHCHASGYCIVAKSATEPTNLRLDQHIDNLILAGIGELFLNDVNRDGCMSGFDIELLRSVSQVPVPLVICGGAGNLDHVRQAFTVRGVTGVAAGSMFVFYGKHRAVLVTYPNPTQIDNLFSQCL